MLRSHSLPLSFSALFSLPLLAMCSALHGQTSNGEPDLSSFTLEQLTHMEVNTASRQAQELFKTPAAVFVITQEDIARSGATSVPELLRMVPGLEVAQIDANSWAVSARGFNSRFSNKMLIMIDQRTIYNPTYSGTFWDQNDLLLENIDRIEIIRGPGGTMWGANAVNGVINIVTKRAGDTRGALAAAHGGRIDEGGAVRYGWPAHEQLNARIDTQYIRRNDLETATGGSAHDHGSEERVETRLDWKASARDQLSAQGALFRNPEWQVDDLPGEASGIPDFAYGAGGDAVARWEHKRAISDFALQAYYSEERRREAWGVKVNMQTADLDFQHHVAASSRNDLIWGAGYRWTSDRSFGNAGYFAHADHFQNQPSAFIQDSYAMVPDKLNFTVGTKLLWNTYTHFEVQPRVSLAWIPNNSQAIWLAVSRAVRIPSDEGVDLDFVLPVGEVNGIPLIEIFSGNRNLPPEVVLAYEGGYRHRLGNRVSVDLAGFVNHYTDLNATYFGTPYLVTSPTVYMVEPTTFVNGFSANTQGVEASLGWSPEKNLRLLGSYTWTEGRLKPTYYQNLSTIVGQDWNTPRNTFDVRAYWNATSRWAITAIVSGDSTITAALAVGGAGYVPQYTRADLRATRKLGRDLEFSAGGTNLTNPRHKEFYVDDYVATSYIPRGAYIALRWAR